MGSDFTVIGLSRVTESEKIKFKERADMVKVQKSNPYLDLVQGWRRIEKDANVGTEIININTAWKQKLMKVPEI